MSQAEKPYYLGFLFISLSIGISGCVATRKNLNIDYYKKFDFILEADYEEVYRTLLAKVRDKYTMVWPGNRGIVENDLYPDSESVRIRATFFNDLTGEYIPMRIDISNTPDAKSKIVIYSSKHGFSTSVTKDELQNWIKPFISTSSN